MTTRSRSPAAKAASHRNRNGKFVNDAKTGKLIETGKNGLKTTQIVLVYKTFY